MINKYCRSIAFRMFENFRHGSMAVQMRIPGESEEVRLFGNLKNGNLKKSPKKPPTLKQAEAFIVIKDERFFQKIIFLGDIGLGEAYMYGYWETNDLRAVISWFIQNREFVPTMIGSKVKKGSLVHRLYKPFGYLFNRLRKNTLSMSVKNIREHYDLSNDFFRLFLDESMTYSSGIFFDKNCTLKEAQIAKYDRLCYMLDIKKGDTVLEIGSGWGGFATYAHKVYGAKVTSITLSKAQYDYAVALRKRMGISAKDVDFRIIDYRKVQGSFDKIVSIEMIEAVGHDYMDSYFSVFQKLLKPDGVFGLQAIVCPDSRFEQSSRKLDWLQKHIFPGSNLPSVKSIVDSIFATGDFFIYDLYDLGRHYVKTLATWHKSFNARLSKIRALGYDDVFIRKWNFYLKICEAAFATRYISVVQVIFSHPNTEMNTDRKQWTSPSKKATKIPFLQEKIKV